MGMALKFEQDRKWDDGICAVGRWDLVKIWAGTEMEIGSPLQGPLCGQKISQFSY